MLCPWMNAHSFTSESTIDPFLTTQTTSRAETILGNPRYATLAVSVFCFHSLVFTKIQEDWEVIGGCNHPGHYAIRRTPWPLLFYKLVIKSKYRFNFTLVLYETKYKFWYVCGTLIYRFKKEENFVIKVITCNMTGIFLFDIKKNIYI